MSFPSRFAGLENKVEWRAFLLGRFTSITSKANLHALGGRLRKLPTLEVLPPTFTRSRCVFSGELNHSRPEDHLFCEFGPDPGRLKAALPRALMTATPAVKRWG